MPVHFDPYQQWLGIPPSEQPPHHYRLLGVELFERHPEVFQAAAEQRTAYLSGHLRGAHGERATQLIQEVSAAWACLADPRKRAVYDEQLRSAQPPVATGLAPPPGPVASQPATPPAGPVAVVPAGGEPSSGRAGAWFASGKGVPNLAVIAGAFAVASGLIVGFLFWRASSRPDHPAGSVAEGEGEGEGARDESEGATVEPIPDEPLKPPAASETAPVAVAPPADVPAAPDVPDAPAAPDVPDAEPTQTAPAPGSSGQTAADSPEPKPPETAPATPEPKVQPAEPAPSSGEPPAAGPPAAPPEDAVKLPIPSSEDQQKVLEQLKEVHDLDRNRTPAESLELARQLFDLGGESSAGSTERFVLLRTAMDRAGDGGDAALMLEAVDAIGQEFGIDVLDVKQKVLNTFARKASSPEATRSMIENTMAAVDDALEQRNYEAALRLVGAAHVAARRPAGSGFRKDVSSRKEEIEELRLQWRQIQQAKSVLEADPENGRANLTVGLWYCLDNDDWQQGLPYLAKSSDRSLKAVAQLEQLASKDDAKEQLAVADAWWDVAQTRDGRQKLQFVRHAGSWYERAQGAVDSSLVRLRIEKRLEEIAKLQPAGQSAPEIEPKLGDALPTLEWFDLVKWIDPKRDGVAGLWQKDNTGVRVSPAPFARMMLPMVVQGSYDVQFEFTRNAGDDAIAAVLPVGDTGCVVVLAGGHGTYSGVETLARRSADNNPSTKGPTKFSNGQAYTVLIRVRIQGDVAAVETLVNGTPYLRAMGPQASLAVSRDWTLPAPDRPALGANGSDVTFRKIGVRVGQQSRATLGPPAETPPE